MANHGPSYGLSRELEKKNIARFSLEEAQEVLLWIEQVTDVQFERDPATIENSQDMSDMLKDGVQLCMMMNCVLENPRAVRFHAKPRMPFHKMENISNFLDAIKTYGVAEISCFQTVDLYENKQGYKVIECLRSLAAVKTELLKWTLCSDM
uniref:Calponin-homology (CH) domain-containing protein n=1 Tax=Steinernema glaseri TaxID=37863 RepID=A0A1I7ZQM5_9BILA